MMNVHLVKMTVIRMLIALTPWARSRARVSLVTKEMEHHAVVCQICSFNTFIHSLVTPIH